MPQIENLQPTTELQAVNAMLASIGQAPIAALGSGHPDEDVAVEILRETTKELQGRRWRFNSEYGYTLTPEGTDGALNVFAVPADLASWKLSLIEAQRGLDVIAREARTYVGDSEWIFADRLNGTDGIDLPELKINPVWFVDFEKMPQTARRYSTIVASRRFQNQAIGQNTDSPFGFTETDEDRALTLLLEDQQESVPVPPTGTSPATEIEALNEVLLVSGKDPVVSLEALHSRDQFHALQILRDASREIQLEGWRFNTDESFELAPSGTYDWLDSSGETEELNVWEVPSNLLEFDVARVQNQTQLSISAALSDRYENTGENVLVFRDRVANRDGLPSSKYDHLYIDAVWFVAYENLPEAARQYILIFAARRFLSTQPANERPNLPWTERDVRQARRTLTRKQGRKSSRNIFDHPEMWEHLGRRRARRHSLTRQITRR